MRRCLCDLTIRSRVVRSEANASLSIGNRLAANLWGWSQHQRFGEHRHDEASGRLALRQRLDPTRFLTASRTTRVGSMDTIQITWDAALRVGEQTISLREGTSATTA